MPIIRRIRVNPWTEKNESGCQLVLFAIRSLKKNDNDKDIYIDNSSDGGTVG